MATTLTPTEWMKSLCAAPRTRDTFLYYQKSCPDDVSCRAMLEGFLHSLPIDEYVGWPPNKNTHIPPFPSTRGMWR
jgi:hypothetical protein